MLSSEQRSELKSKLQKHAVLCVEQSRFCKTEEATKQSLVLRFFSMLGYDVFNMQEVIPEFSTGFSDKIKKRADYVIAKNGEPSIIVECKSTDTALENVDKGQLKEYFTTCKSVKLAILTNGIVYEFYADCKETNIMDETPFVVLDMENICKNGVSDETVNAVSHFVKSELEPTRIKDEAKKKLIDSAIMKFLEKNSKDPSDQFVKLVLVSTGIFKVVTSNIIKNYKKVLIRTINAFIESNIRERILLTAEKHEVEPVDNLEGIVTTEGELKVYNYAIKRLAFLVDSDELYDGLRDIRYQDYKTTFVVYYKKIVDGRLFNLKELENGLFNFSFPILQREITTAELRDIDEALLTSYKLRFTSITKKTKGIKIPLEVGSQKIEELTT